MGGVGEGPAPASDRRNSPYVIDYKGRFILDAPPRSIWRTIERWDEFESWWAWLNDFSIDGPGLSDGTVLSGVVAPPVPYRMRLHVDLGRCSPPHRIEAAVHGDLEGTALLVLDPVGQRTAAEISWSIEMMQRPMRLAARFARPLLTWGHDRVVDMTVASFRKQLTRP